MTKKLFYTFILLSSFITLSQTTLKGTIFNEYLEPFPGAIIKYSSGSTTSNFDGEFTLVVKKLPITITISSVGYSSEIIEITNKEKNLNIILKETFSLDQVVISASRTPERVMESPVTIERIDSKYIKKTASPNFYESIRNLKGMDVLDNNFLTKIVTSNRGFSSADNNRFVQLVDGFDTSVPTFDYSQGNLFGLNELDVKNVEILPGAASALYGANAFNGILLMTSKSPFTDTGISVSAKSGITTQEDRGTNNFVDVGTRFAYKFTDWFAAKVNINYIKAQDWLANDRSDVNGNGNNNSENTGYDGVNVYGDEVGLNVVDLALLANQTPLAALNPLALVSAIDGVENQRITRTGYDEANLVDYNVNNIRIDGALHFKPWGAEKTELILTIKQSYGDNITQASNRYFQSGSYQALYGFEVKGNNYFVRGYYNESDAGTTTDSRLAGIFVNSTWKDNTSYFLDYGQEYLTSLALGESNEKAHSDARIAADTGRFNPGSSDFNTALTNASNTDVADGGARVLDASAFYHADVNWNLADNFDFADIQVGGSFRSYALDSKGQIYTDDDGVIRHRQYGAYTQIQKKFLEDRMKFTGTVRFDKARNFDGNFTPRATLSYAAGSKRDHNFRIGYQTGFRNPTSQDQYLGLSLGNTLLLGSVEENLDREVLTRPLTSDSSVFATISGVDAFNNSYTEASVEAFRDQFRSNLVNGTTVDATSLLEQSNYNLVKPETVQSIELGYRGAVDVSGNLLEFDVVGFYNTYKDFITATEVIVPLYGEIGGTTSAQTVTAISLSDFQRYQITTNAKSNINTFGFSAGFVTKFFGNFDFGVSYAFADFNVDEVENDVDFDPAFNTPKNAVKVQFGNDKLFKNFGFATNLRWQDAYLYQTRFLNNGTIAERFVVDAQVNYTIPKIKSTIKIGGTNLTGKEYVSVLEAGTIGSQYYISWIINN